MSRLAERIRNTEPWCKALLKAPTVIYDRLWDHPVTPMRMLWEPGFVVKWVLDARRGETPEGETIHLGQHSYQCEMTLAVRRAGGNLLCLLFEESLDICEFSVVDGGVLEDSMITGVGGSFRRQFGDKDLSVQEFMMNSYVLSAWHCLEIVFRLLDCKNVHLEERRSPPKRRSKGKDKRQVESYHVLNIPGSPRYWERSNSDGLRGIQHRLHVVRGHFRHYTADKPHVSGWVGPMWISSHARGNAELGTIEKDYTLQVAP